MIESRCGIICSECTFREQFNCTGCSNITQPAWGQCEVKSCCESREKAHCGQCQSFPCQVLENFSYDPVHGDNGFRIGQCKKWNGD